MHDTLSLKACDDLAIHSPLSEESAKDLAHSLPEGLNNMFKDIFQNNRDSWRLAEEKEGNSSTE